MILTFFIQDLFFFKKVKGFDLNIELAEGDLQTLIWEAYVMLNGFFEMSRFVKLYENTRGVTWGKLNNNEQSQNSIE